MAPLHCGFRVLSWPARKLRCKLTLLAGASEDLLIAYTYVVLVCCICPFRVLAHDHHVHSRPLLPAEKRSSVMIYAQTLLLASAIAVPDMLISSSRDSAACPMSHPPGLFKASRFPIQLQSYDAHRVFRFVSSGYKLMYAIIAKHSRRGHHKNTRFVQHRSFHIAKTVASTQTNL